MKMKFLIVTSALILAGNVFAKEVSVPFINRAVPLEGLSINYSLDGKNPQKVVCIFDNFEMGSLKYSENNIEKEALPFAVDQEVYFTNKGETWNRNQGLDNLQQFHVDIRGRISVKEEDYKYRAQNSMTAYATCFYLPENN